MSQPEVSMSPDDIHRTHKLFMYIHGIHRTHKLLLAAAEKSSVYTALDSFERKHARILGFEDSPEDFGCDLREGDNY